MSERTEFELTHPDARLPVLATEGSAAYDLYSVESSSIQPMSVKSFDTGLRIKKIPKDTFILLASRSGLALKQACFCIGGVIDGDYEGNIRCLLYNGSPTEPVDILRGQRVCQALVLPRLRAIVQEKPLKKRRGRRGFGSSNDLEIRASHAQRTCSGLSDCDTSSTTDSGPRSKVSDQKD